MVRFWRRSVGDGQMSEPLDEQERRSRTAAILSAGSPAARLALDLYFWLPASVRRLIYSFNIITSDTDFRTALGKIQRAMKGLKGAAFELVRDKHSIIRLEHEYAHVIVHKVSPNGMGGDRELCKRLLRQMMSLFEDELNRTIDSVKPRFVLLISTSPGGSSPLGEEIARRLSSRMGKVIMVSLLPQIPTIRGYFSKNIRAWWREYASVDNGHPIILFDCLPEGCPSEPVANRSIAEVLMPLFLALGERIEAFENILGSMSPFWQGGIWVAGEGFRLGINESERIIQVIPEVFSEAIGPKVRLKKYSGGRWQDHYEGVVIVSSGPRAHREAIEGQLAEEVKRLRERLKRQNFRRIGGFLPLRGASGVRIAAFGMVPKQVVEEEVNFRADS